MERPGRRDEEGAGREQDTPLPENGEDAAVEGPGEVVRGTSEP